MILCTETMRFSSQWAHHTHTHTHTHTDLISLQWYIVFSVNYDDERGHFTEQEEECQFKEESVAQGKSTRSWKSKLSMIKCGHQMDGWLLCGGLCTCHGISLESDSVQTLQESFRWEYNYKLRYPVCIWTQKRPHYMHIKDPEVCVRVLWFMETPK